MRSFTAIVRVTGSAGRFEEFRERVRWLLVRDPDTDPYTEHHAAAIESGRLVDKWTGERNSA